MKMTIEWHKQVLQNMISHEARETKELESFKARMARLRFDISQRRDQIQEAERQGKDGFDADRFLQPRKREGSKP